jgi:hypothetical protein
MELDPPEDFYELTAEDLQRMQAQAAAKRKVRCAHAKQQSRAFVLLLAGCDFMHLWWPPPGVS